MGLFRAEGEGEGEGGGGEETRDAAAEGGSSSVERRTGSARDGGSRSTSGGVFGSRPPPLRSPSPSLDSSATTFEGDGVASTAVSSFSAFSAFARSLLRTGTILRTCVILTFASSSCAALDASLSARRILLSGSSLSAFSKSMVDSRNRPSALRATPRR